MENKSLSENQLIAIVEGLLFIFGNEGINITNIANNLKMSEAKAEKLINQLVVKHNNDQQSGIKVVKFGDLYKLATKVEHYQYYQSLKDTPPLRLSQAALETLAIISYNQPVTKPRIEEIRGVNCDGIIQKLKALNFIMETGKSDLPGRPYLYVTTNDFMDQFQISSLADLPILPNYNLADEEQEIYNYSDES